MQALQAIGGLAYLIAAAALGIRLLARAQRERQMPELLIGIAFLSAAVLGTPLEIAGEVRGLAHPGEAAASLLAGGKLLSMIGLNAMNLFTWLVFRPGRSWAGALFLSIFAGQLAAFGGFAASGAFLSGVVSTGWFWIELFFRAAGSIWMLSECLDYAAKMRRQVALGLVEPMVAHRFALWAGGNLGGLLMLATSIAPRVLGVEGVAPQLMVLVFAGAGTISAGCYWLAFFPTARYRRWVEARLSA